MGNMKANGLPCCQLLRVQSLVNALYPESLWPVPFWMDTICVPRKYPARSIAITTMKDIYKNADTVLVLDAVLMQTNDKAEATEILLRLRGSTWVTRLWMYHEAGLAKSLHYQLSNVAVNSVEIWSRHQQERLRNDLLKRESCDNANGRRIWITRHFNERDAQERRVRRRLDSLDLLLHDGIAFMQELESFKERPEAEDYIRLADISGPLRCRWTSRLGDEAICLSGLLGRSVDDLVDLSAVQRMKRLLLTLESVPNGILFVDLPRLQDDCYRWMPATFLGRGSRASMYSVQKAIPSPSGLCTTLPGIFIDMAKEVSEYVSGISHNVFVDIGGTFYTLRNSSEACFNWSDYAGERVAVILKESLTCEEMVKGVLVRLKGFHDGVHGCRFEYAVNVDGFDGVREFMLEKEFVPNKAAYCYENRWRIT
jgi:hypothetical protein